MPWRQKLECGLLVFAVAWTRWLFRSHYLYDLDSVNFALGMRRFDPVMYQPHPPGYFLYIYLGRLVNVFLHDPNAALVAISIAASCGAAALIYSLTYDWFSPKAATFAGLIFLFSPLVWFHGTVALIYMVEAFLSALLGLLCWRIYIGRETFVFPAALVLGLGTGVRQSFFLFLAPLFLFSLSRVPRKRAAAALLVLLAALLAWFVPMVEASGGLSAYLSSLLSLWLRQGGHNTVWNSSPLTTFDRLSTIALIYDLCFGAAVIFAVGIFRPKNPTDKPKALFTRTWLLPGLLFFTFVFLPVVNSGYLLVLLPPLCAWMGHWGAEWYARVQWPKTRKLATVGLAAAVNVLIFLKAPLYCSYDSVRKFEAELNQIREAIPRIASPQQVLIVAFDSHFLGFRHAGYYLPEYFVAECPDRLLPGGRRVFTMRNRNTELAARLQNTGFRKFLLFPLPSADESLKQFVSQIHAIFPPKDLETIHAGSHDFVLGPISDLPLLFPEAGPIRPPALTAGLK
jgi:4-amino-4-deoxy-L-arabinose transferase-like glycosyltransferase